MEEKTDRTATKVEEQVALLTETVAQQAYAIEALSIIMSALLYNVKNDMSYRNVKFVTPNWSEDKNAREETTKLCDKIIEALKKDGQRKTDKS